MSALKRMLRRISGMVHAPRLTAGIQRLEGASLEQLQDREFLLSMIRQIGLRYDRRKVYGPDNRCMNFGGPGLWQVPAQFAECLLRLGSLRPASMVEIGTCDGWTFAVMTAYLSRFQAGFRAVTIDKEDQFQVRNRLKKWIDFEFHGGKTSDDFRSQKFDLCFIDGDHSSEWCRRDYENLGRHAQLCMFHDINDRYVGAENVPAFWQELKKTEAEIAEFAEFTSHPENEPIMGIGLRIRKAESTAKTLPEQVRRRQASD